MHTVYGMLRNGSVLWHGCMHFILVIILFCCYACTAMLQALSGHQTEGGNELSQVTNKEDDQAIAKEDGKSILLSVWLYLCCHH